MIPLPAGLGLLKPFGGQYAEYWRLYFENFGADTAVQLCEFDLRDSTNISMMSGAIATAKSYYSSAVPENTIDGNISTYWQNTVNGGNDYPTWIKYQLSALNKTKIPYYIQIRSLTNGIGLNGKAYLQKSDDGITFANVQLLWNSAGMSADNGLGGPFWGKNSGNASHNQPLPACREAWRIISDEINGASSTYFHTLEFYDTYIFNTSNTPLLSPVKWVPISNIAASSTNSVDAMFDNNNGTAWVSGAIATFVLPHWGGIIVNDDAVKLSPKVATLYIANATGGGYGPRAGRIQKWLNGAWDTRKSWVDEITWCPASPYHALIYFDAPPVQTFNPYLVSPNITLSGGNMIATANASFNSMAPSIPYRNLGGLMAFEVVVNALNGSTSTDRNALRGFGFYPLGLTQVNAIPGTLNPSIGWQSCRNDGSGTPQYGVNASFTAYGNKITAGDIIGMTYNTKTKAFQAYINGVAQGGGWNITTPYCFAPAIGTARNGDQFTIKFTELQYLPSYGQGCQEWGSNI